MVDHRELMVDHRELQAPLALWYYYNIIVFFVGTVLGQSKVDFALGHRKRGTYAFAHLVLKNVINVFPCGTGNSSSSTVRIPPYRHSERSVSAEKNLALTPQNPL